METGEYYIRDNSNIEEQKMDAARNLYSSGNYFGALKLYLDMVNTSYSYMLYHEIGKCYYKLEDFVNAEAYFTRSIELEDRKNPSYVFLGNIHYKNNNITKAIENWITSYSYKPDDESVCLNLATTYYSLGMKFQAILYYEKYLKYAKNKTSSSYMEIKKSLDEYKKTGEDFFRKAQLALNNNDINNAMQLLEYAAMSCPTSFDINFAAAKICYELKNKTKALTYLEQAYSLDNKSFDVLSKIPYIMLELGDISGAYCFFKRLVPLIINKQKEYLEIIKNIKQLENNFDGNTFDKHYRLANKYFTENNYHFALIEYENCMLINGVNSEELGNKIQLLKSFINPEMKIIRVCFDKAESCCSIGDYRLANKYFTKIMQLSNENSIDYRQAKARLSDV